MLHMQWGQKTPPSDKTNDLLSVQAVSVRPGGSRGFAELHKHYPPIPPKYRTQTHTHCQETGTEWEDEQQRKGKDRRGIQTEYWEERHNLIGQNEEKDDQRGH